MLWLDNIGSSSVQMSFPGVYDWRRWLKFRLQHQVVTVHAQKKKPYHKRELLHMHCQVHDFTIFSPQGYTKLLQEKYIPQNLRHAPPPLPPLIFPSPHPQTKNEQFTNKTRANSIWLQAAVHLQEMLDKSEIFINNNVYVPTQCRSNNMLTKQISLSLTLWIWT